MIDLLARSLHSVREPEDHVRSGVSAEQSLRMVQPGPGRARIAPTDHRRSVEVEARAPGSIDPSAVRDQPVPDQLRLSRRPCHLLDGLVTVEPGARLDEAVVLLNRQNPRVHAGGRPHLPARREDVAVHRHVGVKVGQLGAVTSPVLAPLEVDQPSEVDRPALAQLVQHSPLDRARFLGFHRLSRGRRGGGSSSCSIRFESRMRARRARRVSPCSR